MSPEIFKNKPYSYKSDVWALGCVLYEMTTLNHAFDANSLNGLATKIVKGKYPPINAKYSKFLRELIGQMLQINPQQRPDLDQILRKPFIKKHIVNFFTDIASRPSGSLGEGTMIFKAAAGGPVSNNALGSDTNMISLRQQLHALDMTDAIGDALKPKSNPQDDEEAIRLAKEQASALKREQEHKKMVEAALEKLRLERESRKNAEPIGRPVGYAQGRQPSQAAISAAKRVEDAARLAGYRQPAPVSNIPQRPSNSNLNGNNAVNSEAARKESAAVRDRGINWNKRPEEKGGPGARQPAPSGDSDNVSVGDRVGGPARRRSFGEDRDRIVERERRAAEERRKLQQDQEAARVKAEDRRRDEVRAEARAREEARLREEARQKEEVAARSNLEKVRAQAEAAAKAKREQQREKERDRQKAEFDQLKRDKLELDRRTNERDRVRDERRAQERSRLEGGRRDLDAMQEKLSHMNDQIQQIPKFEPRNRAEEKEDLSARERVAMRRQEKVAREEAERMEALREAESENRRIRQQAQQQHRSQWHADSGPANKYREEEERYEFDSANRSKPKGRMDAEELTDRLNDATKGKGHRYDAQEVPNTGRSSLGGRGSVADNNEYNSDDSEEGTEWGERGDVEEEEEDMHRREEELQAELNFATLRVNELKRTLQETKSYLGPRMPTRGKDVAGSHTPAARWAVGEEEDGEAEDEDEFYETDEEEYEVVSCRHRMSVLFSGVCAGVRGRVSQQQESPRSTEQPGAAHRRDRAPSATPGSAGGADRRQLRPARPALAVGAPRRPHLSPATALHGGAGQEGVRGGVLVPQAARRGGQRCFETVLIFSR